MKHLPIALKILLNLIFLSIYWGIMCLGVVFIYAMITEKYIDAALANKIGILSFLAVVFITVVLRKIFYISLKTKQEISLSNTEEKPKEKKQAKKEKQDMENS